MMAIVIGYAVYVIIGIIITSGAYLEKGTK
jgi:hypothetical protein